MPEAPDARDIRLNFDPVEIAPRFSELKAAKYMTFSHRIPSIPAWPRNADSEALPLAPEPVASDSLSRFQGYDAVIVTWTAAEASALAALLAPNHPVSTWYNYQHNVEEYLPLVTGADSPFNDDREEMKRYYHSLALYFPRRIGKARVLLMKSGLHLDYDGPAVPVRKLMIEIATTVKPKVFITTGTGGGIGADVKLGDVIVAERVRFDCAKQFKSSSWAKAKYRTSNHLLPGKTFTSITPAMLKLNAEKIPGARPVPKIWVADSTIVTTDFFAFDDSTDFYHLQGRGTVCDTGDAMVGQAMSQAKQKLWFAVRNASDPQIPNPLHDIEEATKTSSEIYTRYGALTTAGSVIACWAIVNALCNK